MDRAQGRPRPRFCIGGNGPIPVTRKGDARHRKVAPVQARRVAHDLIRIAFAATGIVAMVYQYTRLQPVATFRPGNFFSFFTIQANILAVTALVLAALIRRAERTVTFDAIRGAATFYIAITGVVFALLLSGHQEQLDTHNAFANFVVHYLMPVVLVVDWLIDPPTHRLPPKVALAWLGYPFAWFVYTLTRGHFAHWYPYPFVDVPAHGYGGVLLRGVVFLAAFAAGAAAFARVSRLKNDR